MREFTIIAVLAALAAPAYGEDASPTRAKEELGEVSFETSCAEAAAAPFERGLLLLHHMMYRQSAAAFEEAAAADPDCAMAQWGIAMTKFHPLWPGGPTPEETAAGRTAAEQLAAMTPGSEREAAYVEAVLAFYSGEDVPYRERLAAWAKAQRALAETYDDPDARAFASLAQLTVAPRGADAVPDLIEAGERMDALRREAPGHPGAYHYAIHAYDHPALAERGLEVARAYVAIAPEVPHALHMPTHIFTRLGLWEEAIDLNVRSAAAVLNELDQGDGVIAIHHPHAIDYAVYAHLQLGQLAKAKEVLAGLDEHGNLEDSFGTAYAAAAAPSRLPLEEDDWETAALLPTDMHSAVTWDRYPQAVAIRWFAKGLGAARSNDVAAAREALKELVLLGDAMRERDAGYWLSLLDAQTKAIEGWIAHSEGDDETAVALISEAADIEDGVGKAPVTPGHVLPARELLGDLLQEIGRMEEAAQAYEACLEASPNRRRSVAGLAIVSAR